MQIFGVPNHHPKAKPFIDHIMSFYILDNRVWIRNYQVRNLSTSSMSALQQS